jgi:endonuclease YncB( thermonuclease family)
MKTTLLILLLAATPAVAGPLSISGPARVTDGDTIIINGTRIRIQGLDAEELAMTNGRGR